jgi:hypothetical protein
MATTSNYSWTTPDDSDPFRNGASAIRSLGSSVDSTLFTALGGAYPGLRLVKKQTIGTAVSNVTVTDAFSATYGAYKVMIVGGTASASGSIAMQLGASTTGYSGALPYVTYSTAAQLILSDNNQASFRYLGVHGTTFMNLDVDLVNPFLAQPTLIRGSYIAPTISGQYIGTHSVATSYSSFVIGPTSGTFTGGTIYVYGYGTS